MQLLQCTASPPGGSWQCNSCNALPHCLGGVDSATPAMHCLTAWGQWTVELLQCIAPLPWGSGQWNSCNALPHCLGAVGSATPAMHCLTAPGQWAVQLLQCTAPLPGGRSVLQGLWGRTPGHTGLGEWGVQPRGWSEFPAGPVGMDNRAHRPGGLGSPAQGVVGVSCRASGEEDSGTLAWGDGESCPGVGRSVLLGLWGSRFGHTTPRGRRVLPRGGQSVLQGLWARRPGHTGLGGWGVLPRGWSEFLAGPAGIDNRAHRPGRTGSPAQGVVGASCRACGGVERGTPAWGDGESSQAGGRSFPQGLRGWTTGPTGLVGWGVLPRGWSEPPAGTVGT